MVELSSIRGKRPPSGSLAREYGVRVCLECNAPFWPRRADATYCCNECKTKGYNLEVSRARSVYRILYHWRNGSLSGAFTEISRMVDGWIREDREAGRKAPPWRDK